MRPLRRLVEQYGSGRPPFATSRDLYRELKASAPPAYHYLLEDFLATITLWDLRTTAVAASPAGGGAWRVTLDVEAQKLRADGSGKETEVPMNDFVDVGVFGKDSDEPLYLAKHRIRSGRQRIAVVVKGEPAKAGIDPELYLIDRNWTDNTRPVPKQKRGVGEPSQFTAMSGRRSRQNQVRISDRRPAVPHRTDEEGEQETSGRSRRRIVLSAIAFVALLAAISIAAGSALEREGLPRLVERLRAFGDHWWAPLALVAAFVVVNLTGIPGTPLTLAAGVVWGWLAGGLWVMAAIMIGTAVPYFITRQRVPRLRRTIENSFGTLSQRLRGHGLTNVALLRLVHVFPFAAISYAAGLAGVKLRDYLIGTFIGTLPGVFIYTWLADAILRGLVSTEQAALRIGVAAVLLVALIVVSRWLGRKVDR